jgi:spore germination protein YaaH
VIPTITDGTDKLVLANLLSTESGRTAAVQAIVDLVAANSFDGIDLDFENFAFVDGNTSWDKTKPNWVAFVKSLSAALHANGKLLSITSPYLLDPATGKRDITSTHGQILHQQLIACA